MDKQSVQKINELLIQTEKYISSSFKDINNPYQYIDYDTFLNNFPINQTNFRQQNLNIIDVHLRYRWWVKEKMSPYKWIPIVLMTPLIFRNFYIMLGIPYFTVKMFDHYFQRFFLWRHRKDRIINVRNEFISKLSKRKNIIRRLELYNSIKSNLKPSTEEEKWEPPLKYIKFGQFTEYIFHAMSDGKEQSSIMQTTLFQTFFNLKTLIWELSRPTSWLEWMSNFKKDFKQFRKDPNRSRYMLNLNSLLERPEIKQVQVYTLQDNIDDNVRRWTELSRFFFKGSLQPCDFKLWQHTNLSIYYDIFQALRFNCKDNWSDLALYYAVLSVPKLLNSVFRRR